MRRSQRLIERKDIADKTTSFKDNNTSISQKPCAVIQIHKGSADSGCVRNEKRLPQLPTEVDEVNSTELTKNILNCFKNTFSEAKEVNSYKIQHVYTQENNSNSVKRNLKRRLSTVAAPVSTAGRGKKSCATQSRTVRRNKKPRLSGHTQCNNISTHTISIDNYLNPLRNPLIQADSTAQPLENNGLYCCNINIPKMNLQSNKESLLPPIYPTHFTNQNIADRLINPALQLKPVSMWEANVQPENHFPTPELTESLDFESSTSSLSLPESLREVFGCENIRDVLKMDKIIFRMRILHLQTLAFVLNIEYDYLHNLVQKIMQLDTETLEKVVFAFQPEAELV